MPTERSRHHFQVLTSQQPRYRRRLTLTRHPAAASGRRCARLVWPLRAARPRSDVLLLVHDTPLTRKSSAYEVSQSTVGRGNGSPRLARVAPVGCQLIRWVAVVGRISNLSRTGDDLALPVPGYKAAEWDPSTSRRPIAALLSVSAQNNPRGPRNDPSRSPVVTTQTEPRLRVVSGHSAMPDQWWTGPLPFGWCRVTHRAARRAVQDRRRDCP